MAIHGQRIWDHWLTYLERSHGHIGNEGDFSISLEFHYNQHGACCCWVVVVVQQSISIYFAIFQASFINVNVNLNIGIFMELENPWLLHPFTWSVMVREAVTTGIHIFVVAEIGHRFVHQQTLQTRQREVWPSQDDGGEEHQAMNEEDKTYRARPDTYHRAKT